MARRRLTIKRIDPWSVLRFGVLANLVLLLIFLLAAWVMWFIIDRLRLIDQVCDIALDVGFTSCAFNASNLAVAVLVLGGMWVVVQTALLVFLAFLYNLISDLTGGLVIGVIEDAPVASAAPGPAHAGDTSGRASAVRAEPSTQDTQAQPRSDDALFDQR